MVAKNHKINMFFNRFKAFYVADAVCQVMLSKMAVIICVS